MRFHYLTASLLALSAFSLPAVAQTAQFTTVNDVMRECPDLSGAIACGPIAARFIAAPNDPSDTELTSLVLSPSRAKVAFN